MGKDKEEKKKKKEKEDLDVRACPTARPRATAARSGAPSLRSPAAPQKIHAFGAPASS